MLIDTHAHLNHQDFDNDVVDVLQRAEAMGVGQIINVGFDLASSRKSLMQAQQYPQLYGVVGIHPHDAKETSPQVLTEIAQLAQDKKVVAIGETGLDYHYDLSPREIQRQSFRSHIQLAKKLNLPLVIHSREAAQDTFQILKEEGANNGVMHCYSGSMEMALKYLQMGLYISFAGPITFNNAKKLQEVAKGMPLEKLLVETDAPYLTPTPHRGKRNEPGYTAFVAQKLAELQAKTVEEIIQTTTANAKQLFGIEG